MNETLRVFHAKIVETFVKNVQQLEYFEKMAADYAGKDSAKHGYFVGQAATLKDEIYKCASGVVLSVEKCFPELAATSAPVAPVPEFVNDFNC